MTKKAQKLSPHNNLNYKKEIPKDALEIYDKMATHETLTQLTSSAKTCCFTGHRPEKLPLPDSEDMKIMYSRLRQAIQSAVYKGYSVFINGGCCGVDIIAAEIVIDIKKNRKYRKVQLVTIMPFHRQSAKWDDEWKERHKNVMRNSDCILILHKDYCHYAFDQRNHLMVLYSDLCIAVSDGKPSGTQNTIKMAVDKGIKVYRIPTDGKLKPAYKKEKVEIDIGTFE